jgi:hypothetical protein
MAINDRELSSASKYDIYAKLMFLANKYFDVQNEDFLKVGLFGYVTESMAMIARDSSLHKTMLYNESFLNTAVMPKSVYNWAKMFNVGITAATPAYTDIQVTIPIDSLIFNKGSSLPNASKYGVELSDSVLGQKEMLVLDRDNQFIAGEFKFALERSILIYKDSVDSDIITVKYAQTEAATTLLQELDNYYIKTYITTDNYLSFVVRAYQYEIRQIEKQISSSSFLETKIHKFFFTDQFVGAKLFYTKAGRRTPIELRFSNIETGNENSTQFAYYNLTDVNTLQITFSSAAGDFIPSSNSTLSLELYTTKGAAGNITFVGDVIFRLKEESLKNIPILCNFFNNTSIGGIDSPSINRIKSTIIREISTGGVIVTETDLNNYFLNLTSLLETVNDGQIAFIKKRDDILRRVFSAYILMRDGVDIDGNPAESNYTSKVIPTNTLTADFDITSNISKPFGTIIKRKAGSANEYEYVPSSALDGSDDYYVIPFYMRVNLDPFRKVKYIYNLTDDSTSLSYRNISGASQDVYILPSNISVKRTLEGSNTSPYYIVTASFVTNVNMGETVTATNSEFKLSFFRKGNEVTPIGGQSMSFRKGSNLSIVSINDNDPNRYITTLEFAINVNTDGSEFDFSSESANNDFGTFINLFHNSVSLSLPEDVKIKLDFVNVLEDINLEFIADRFLLLFRNLDELMTSDITINKLVPKWQPVQGQLTIGSDAPSSSFGLIGDFWIDISDFQLYTKTDIEQWTTLVVVTPFNSLPVNQVANNTYYFYTSNTAAPTTANSVLYRYDANTYVTSVTIKDIPVVHQSFFNNEANQTKFIKQLFVYIDLLRENLGRLETNTFFDLKFFNTYGESQYYNTTRTDINLELDIYVFEYTDELASSIKDYVRLLVDNSNERKALRISSLIKDVTNNFSRYVDRVEFKGLNGTFNQFIKETDTITKNLFAPEYFNISNENLANIVVKQIERQD